MSSLLKFDLITPTKDVPLRVARGNLALWLDGIDPGTIINIAGAVSRWSDKSGRGNHAMQSTGSKQPTTGATTQNSLNVITSDGSDAMELPSPLYSIPAGASTIFIVSRLASSGSAERIINATEVGSSRYFMEYPAAAEQVSFISGTTSTVIKTSVNRTDFGIIRGRRSGTTQAIAFNGSSETTDADGNDEAGVDALFIFAQNDAGSNALTGDIAEIILYDKALSPIEITAIESYLSKKWGISVIAPDNISNLVLWIDAADGSTITQVGGAVSKIDDKSGLGNDATQGTGSAQPTTNATTQNGLNVLDFDGGDDFEVADVSGTLFDVANGSNTIFVVTKITTEAGTQTVFDMQESGGSRLSLAFSSNDGEVRYRSRTAATGAVSKSGATNTNFQILRGRRSGTTQAITFDGNTEATNTSGLDEPGIDNCTIGSSGGGTLFTGSIAEITLYDRSLTTAEITVVEAYLAAKWNITI